MRTGEKATVTCPGSLVDQAADKTDDVYGSDKGRKYELEVQECDLNPAYFKPEKLREDTCFYIRSTGKDGQGSNLALTVDTIDLYFPENYGIYNIQAKEFAGDSASNLAQQFTYKASDQSFTSKLHPGNTMFEGANGNLITYEGLAMDQQKFVYYRSSKTIIN